MLRLLAHTSLYVIIGSVCLALAQSLLPTGPAQLIRMTGAFVESTRAGSQQAPYPYPLIDVRVAEKIRPFHVREVEALTDAKQGIPILRNLGSFLIFIGPQEMLNRLQSPEATGRLLKIEGRLYVKERVLVLNSIEAVTHSE